jgi:CDP-diacylglycerol--glycerol-3-phosphate 3-phosphatidyltransferase
LLIPIGLRLKCRDILAPAARLLTSGRVNPNLITVAGFLPAAAAGYALADGRIRLGGVLIGLSGLFDLMDGLVARLGQKESKFGAFLDSTVDRYGEIAVFIGLALLFRATPHLAGVLLALCGSVMVSYLKARAEGLGQSCEVGMLQRPERLLILMVGALIGMGSLKWAIWIVAVLANVTALERLYWVWSQIGGSRR